MAGIDKTYIDGKEYKLYRQWWIENYDKMVKELGKPVWLHTFSAFPMDDMDDVTPEYLANNTADIEYYKTRFDFAIWNTSEAQDKWLVKNCPFQSFRDKMIMVYPPNWKGFKNQSWATPNKKQRYVR